MNELEKILEEMQAIKEIMLSPKNIDCFGEPCKENDCLACVVNKCMEILENHMNDGWIPVEERLPEEAGTYIINALDRKRNIVTFAKWRSTYKQFDMTGARAYWKVIAWKPLPDPYRPERRDNHGEEDETN